MDKADIFLGFCLSFILGVLVSSFLFFGLLIVIILVIISLSFIGIFWQRKEKIVLLGFFLLILSLASYYFSSNYFSVVKTDLMGEVSLIGRVAEEPEKGFKNTKIVLELENKQRVVFYDSPYSNYVINDKVVLSGEAVEPNDYLIKDRISAIILSSQTEIVEKAEKGKMTILREKLKEQIIGNLNKDEGAILLAMILGDESRLDQDLKTKMGLSGLTHVVAISGTHIVLFSIILIEILLFLRISRRKALFLSIFFIAFYVFLVNAPPSAVRSGFMVSFLYLAEIFRRIPEKERNLAFSCFFIILQNPLVLRYDLGFQLSFVAVLGLIYFAPILNKYFSFIKNTPLRETLVATLAAQIFTLPLIVSSFGYISLSSLISNLLIFPIVPIMMIFGLLFPLINFVFFPLGKLMALFSAIFLSYFVFLINFFSKLGILKATIPFFFFIPYYLFFAYLIYKTKKKKDLDFLRY